VHRDLVVRQTKQSVGGADDVSAVRTPHLHLPNLATERPRAAVGVAGLVLGVLSVAAPFLPGKLAFLALGTMILLFGLLQNYAGFGIQDPRAAVSWFSRGGSSILTGILLLAMPKLTFAGLALLLGVSWIASGLSAVVSAFRRSDNEDWFWSMIDGLAATAFGVAIAAQWPISGLLSIGLFVGLRCISAGWSILACSPPCPTTDGADESGLHPDRRLGLPPHARIAAMREELTREESIRYRSDRGWVWLFLFTFFVIHVSRMDVDWTFVGLLSPMGAVAGDAMLAAVIAYGLVAPAAVTWRTMTRGVERRVWRWYLGGVDRDARFRPTSAPLRWWLTNRLRHAIRRNDARGSATAAVGWGLRAGLPFAAILMAMTPLWGVSWFFNTETWVAGVWEAYAEVRVDDWREAMVGAVRVDAGPHADSPEFLAVEPAGVKSVKDFSFIVIGDTGEGDASQHILRDQLLAVGAKPDVKFLVVSSDVIYPAGAMKDYEPKFYLPFKGFTKPIYAVPGNHDWYDALDSFTANFLEPKAARVALRSRREEELRLTTTTEARIDDMIAEAERLRGEYGIQAAKQRAPYFEIHADRFSLIVIDTGILRKIDDDQRRWLEAALQRAGSHFKFVILGHPLYAAGAYQAVEKEFAAVHEILKKHSVDLVMAGDTHDFEFYREDLGGRSMHHFVNGGGGAYLSIGTALAWPKKAPTEESGFYPRADQLSARLDAYTPSWRWPLWWWVKKFGAWPSSPEAMAAAFDYDRAPFFQSFMEIRVEGSTNTVRLHLIGSNGRLRWRDLHLDGGPTRDPNAEVEFAFPLR
jgi:uncharacterized membrane protein HdeD (DUF308 family)